MVFMTRSKNEESGKEERPTGPRGGTTTVTPSGLVKKNLWIPAEDAEALRQKAHHERRSESEILREGLELVLHGEAPGRGRLPEDRADG